jgi:ketosteroid isomerase-like protein
MSSSHTSEKVWDAVVAFNDAFVANDAEAFFAFIDEDVVVITPNNPYRIEGMQPDRAGFEYYLRLGTARVNFFQALQPHIRIVGDVAIVTYYSRGSYGESQPKTAYHRETDILLWRDEQWKIAHIHVSATL